MQGDFLSKVVKSIREIDTDLVEIPEELGATTPKYYVSTQIPTLDRAIGKSGIPSGRITLIYGSEGHGKSTVAYHILAEAQRIGGVGVLLDTEYAFDLERAKRIGVQTDTLLLIHPTTIEEAFQVVDRVINEIRKESQTIPVVIVWDSLAATPSHTEIDKKDRFYDLQPGQQAKVLSSNLRKLIRSIAVNDIVFVLVNQVRENVGVYYGPRETMPGGRAIKFYASLIIRVKREGFVEDESGNRVGIYCLAEVEKNKIAPPFRVAQFIITFSGGVDVAMAYFQAAEDLGLVVRSGGWCSCTGELAGIVDRKFRERDWKTIFTEDVKRVIDGVLEKGSVVREGDSSAS